MFTEETRFLYSEEKDDLDKIDKTKEIQMNEKEKIKHEFYFHFKDIYDKDSSIYEDYTYQIN